jgi:hypothetical protein
MTRVVVCRRCLRVDDVLDMRSRPSPPRPFRLPARHLVAQAAIASAISFSPGASCQCVPRLVILLGGSVCVCLCKAIAMASNLPLPIPPRTPTPPLDEATVHYAPQINSGVAVDRDALSPLRDTFPRSASLDPGNGDRLSPTKSSFSLSPGSADSTPAQNGSSDSTAAGPFNFNTTVMAKGPVVKSVCFNEIVLTADAILICIFLAPEHWTASWPQIQAQ